MAKRITLLVRPKGKIAVDYDGFEGNACYTEANVLRDHLAALGVTLDEPVIDPKKNEIETRKLEDKIRAGTR